MVKNLCKSNVTKLIEEATKRGLVKSYSEFCKTKEGKDTALTKDEIIYYTSKEKGEDK